MGRHYDYQLRGKVMKIQNLVDTLTADRAAFTEYDTFKRDNAPFLIDEYFMTRTEVSDYEIRISVLDYDQNPVVTAVVDIYDDIDEAERQLAFVGAFPDSFRQNMTDAQLGALLDSYETFVAAARFPKSYYTENFDDLRLVQKAVGYVVNGGEAEAFFAVPEPTRKNRRTDYSQHPFRAVAEQIAQMVQDAV